VLVSEWVDSPASLARLIAEGTQEERNHYGRLYVRFLFEGPARVGMLHADPHPGNFRILADGRLGVVDFGAVARLPDGSPEPLGRLTRLALDGDGDGVMREMREQGFIRPGMAVSPEQVMDYLRPILEPLAAPTFTFTREWMREQANRLGDPRREEARVGRMFNLPPSYLLIHRVTLGSIGVLCQLGATAPYRALAERWQPGFAT
jgi:predicted unusual protein kinase regulating ubiquinone biosynthesis (AarF/ABC1/UbiB family)